MQSRQKKMGQACQYYPIINETTLEKQPSMLDGIADTQ